MGAIGAAIDSLRRPEYTGENRCYPCTAVNLVIALTVAVSVLIALDGTRWGSYAYPASVAVFLFSALFIAFRGYLVPGTPALTKRYFPPWLLSLFGKDHEATGLADERADPAAVDVEQRLLAAGALEPIADGEDLTVPPAVREQWRTEIERVREGDTGPDSPVHDRLAAVLESGDAYLSFEDYGDTFRAELEGRTVGTWESRAAFLADLAAVPVLEARVEEWSTLSVPDRGRLLNGFRLFLESCPACDGPLSFGTETVDSCCSTNEVAALNCEDCGERLFESRPL